MTIYCDDCRATPVDTVKLKRKGQAAKIAYLCKDCQRKYWKDNYQIKVFRREPARMIQVRETLVSRQSE
jgi:transposase-like protein